MKQAFYLIGVPGAGKSTLLAAVLHGVHGTPMRAGILRYTQYAHGVQLGASRAAFAGTDALPMHVQPVACQWIAAKRPSVVIGEGDRLANAAFFAHVVALGYVLTVAWLDCPPVVASLRRSTRPRQADAAWLIGRATKVSGLVAQWQAVVWRLDATLPVAQLASQVRQHPALRQLAGDDSPHNTLTLSPHAAPSAD